MQDARKLEAYSYQDYLDIDASTKESERVELIFGDIYMMSGASAKHQDVVGNIFYNIKELAKDKDCKPRVAPFDLKLVNGDDISVVQPDVMIFCKDEELPCAVFEVLSPSTAQKDKGVKKELYEYSGIKEYFIVNPDLKIIDSYLLQDGKYYYVRGFSLGEELPIKCIDGKLEVDNIFEDLEG